MQQHDYVFRFDDLQDELSQVHILSRVPADRPEVMVGVDDTQFLRKRQHRVPAHLADCIDLAVAVAIADRLSLRNADRTCSLHICLPVRHPELWRNGQTTKYLHDLLYWYTLDHWSFEFRSRSVCGRFAERESALPFPPFEETPPEVALWSGGLDSLAGLYHNLSSTMTSQYVLFGTGMNTQIHHKQEGSAHLIANQFQNRTALVQVPYRLENTKEVQKNALQRSRGFVFLLLGAVCASLEDQHILSVYENGIGAINLPFSEAEVGIDHSLSVHPLSLLRMEEFVSSLFGAPFEFHNPFLFKTKGQMCEALVASPASRKLIVSTFTCDRPHREHPGQCGYCSSCLLRRQALAAAGIEDPTSYVTTMPSFDKHSIRSSYFDYYRSMLLQVRSLRDCLSATDPWGQLSEHYLPLVEIIDEMDGWKGMSKVTLIEQLLLLYTCYVHEWEHVHKQVGCELWEGNDIMLFTINQIPKGD